MLISRHWPKSWGEYAVTTTTIVAPKVSSICRALAMGFKWRVDKSVSNGLKYKKCWKLEGALLLLRNLTGGNHPLSEIEGWHATRATRSYEGPAYQHVGFYDRRKKREWVAHWGCYFFFFVQQTNISHYLDFTKVWVTIISSQTDSLLLLTYRQQSWRQSDKHPRMINWWG